MPIRKLLLIACLRDIPRFSCITELFCLHEHKVLCSLKSVHFYVFFTVNNFSVRSLVKFSVIVRNFIKVLVTVFVAFSLNTASVFLRGNSKIENSVLNVDPTFRGEVFCCDV